jgi:Initiation factor 2 subunit family
MLSRATILHCNVQLQFGDVEIFFCQPVTTHDLLRMSVYFPRRNRGLAEHDIPAYSRLLPPIQTYLKVRIHSESIGIDSHAKMVLQAIRYTRGELQILDQLKLPHAEEYDHVYSSTDGWHAIKEMRTRGAPAIAIVAALSLAVELENAKLSSIPEEVQAFIIEKLDYLVTSRPTAVNLADAAAKLKAVVSQAASEAGTNGAAVKDAYVTAAERMLVDDVADNEGIGRHGAEWIKHQTPQGQSGQVSVLTHCNTGYESFGWRQMIKLTMPGLLQPLDMVQLSALSAPCMEKAG